MSWLYLVCCFFGVHVWEETPPGFCNTWRGCHACGRVQQRVLGEAGDPIRWREM